MKQKREHSLIYYQLKKEKDELSRIIGGVSVTDTTLKAAEEMLQQARKS